jgi:hypothetical protein
MTYKLSLISNFDSIAKSCALFAVPIVSYQELRKTRLAFG